MEHLNKFINRYIPKTLASDAKYWAAWSKCMERVRQITLEGVRDHIVSRLHGKYTPYSMWNALTDLFQNSNDHRKLALKEKLRKIKMEKEDSILKYLTKFTQFQDEL